LKEKLLWIWIELFQILIFSKIQKSKTQYFYSNAKINFFSKKNLHNVLRAISNSCFEIGYTQGINSWVGVLLLNGLKAHESFWLIIFLLNKMDLRLFVSPGFPKINVLNYQLEIYMKIHMKDLINRLVFPFITFQYVFSNF